MVVLIGGGSHTGKTALAQRLLEKYHFPYLSQDHLKMGLIRSGYCSLTPESPDGELTGYLWPICREMVKTAIENEQNLVIEGCYLPFTYREDFDEWYLSQIRFVCLVFSDGYIDRHIADILGHACDIEKRLDDGYCTKEMLLRDNRRNAALCAEHGCEMIFIEDSYRVDFVI